MATSRECSLRVSSLEERIWDQRLIYFILEIAAKKVYSIFFFLSCFFYAIISHFHILTGAIP